MQGFPCLISELNMDALVSMAYCLLVLIFQVIEHMT